MTLGGRRGQVGVGGREEEEVERKRSCCRNVLPFLVTFAQMSVVTAIFKQSGKNV